MARAMYIAFATCFALISSLTLPQSTALEPLPVHNVSLLPATAFENLAIRSNGQILATTLGPSATLYQIDPDGLMPPMVVIRLPDVQGALGITEGKRDVFYIAAGNYSLTSPEGVLNSFRLFEVDMRVFSAQPNGTVSHPAHLRVAAELPMAGLLNGITSVNDDVLLATDSLAGLIWRVDITSKNVSIASQDPTMKSIGSNPTGINGIKILDGWLYYTNSAREALYRIPIRPKGIVHGEAELVIGGLRCDDFVVTQSAAYVASPDNVVFGVANAKKRVLAGTLNSSTSALISPTAVRFGRRKSDRNSLYVTTNGGLTGSGLETTGIYRIDQVIL